MATAEKRSYHHGQLQDALLDAGDRLLHEQGLRGFTLRACARMAGVSHAAPKHHFGDVRGFLTALAARGYRRLTEQLKAGISVARTLEEEFVETSWAYLQFAEDNPEHFRIMFRCDLLDTRNDKLFSEVKTTLTELTNVIHRQRGEPETEWVELDPTGNEADALIGDILIGWSHIHGLAHLHTEQQLDMVPAERFREMIAAVAVRLSQMMQAEARQ